MPVVVRAATVAMAVAVVVMDLEACQAAEAMVVGWVVVHAKPVAM